MLRTFFAVAGIIVAAAIAYIIFTGRIQNPVKTEKKVPLNIDLQEIKPPAWKAVDEKKGLLEINLDDDKTAEWLFLYRNTADTNQIGAVIYDAQNQPLGDASIAISQQSPAFLIPYALMPNYKPGETQGYLGDDAVLYQGVFVDTHKKETNDKILQGDRLQLRGIYRGETTRFSVFWWVNQQIGYNGALAYTPGWFSLSPIHPDQWTAWDDKSPQAITDLWAWEPQVDRSNICRRVLWQLTDGPNAPLTRQFVAFYQDSDLYFCKGSTPAEPAFPEAQVLAYLTDPGKNRKDRWKDGAAQVSYDNVSVFKISEPEINEASATHPVAVAVDFIADHIQHNMVWQVEMQPPTHINDPVRWRIISAVER